MRRAHTEGGLRRRLARLGKKLNVPRSARASRVRRAGGMFARPSVPTSPANSQFQTQTETEKANCARAAGLKRRRLRPIGRVHVRLVTEQTRVGGRTWFWFWFWFWGPQPPEARAEECGVALAARAPISRPCIVRRSFNCKIAGGLQLWAISGSGTPGDGRYELRSEYRYES